MDSDPLSTFLTPPPKRPRLSLVRPSPPRLSDLLAAFGARRIPSSVSRMAKESDSREQRSVKKPFSYAESEDSNPSPKSSPGAASFGESQDSPKRVADPDDDESSEDELQRDDSQLDLDEEGWGDTIQVKPRPVGLRELPKRSARKHISYATPKKVVKKKKGAKGRKLKPIKLTSDLDTGTKVTAPKAETARNKVRNDIEGNTKPKRDAFLLAHKEYFLPLLPETSYIDKLQRLQDMDDEAEPDIVPYETLRSQPVGVKATMKPYQVEGLSFLVYMNKNGMSAILGDEMGLGKTLQTLSLFKYLNENMPTKGENRPYLVVCPLSVLSSWVSEAKKWVPDLNIVRFQGPKAERERIKQDLRSVKEASKIDLVITTYETFVSEQGWFKRAFVWRYCVLDEGHKIKNSKADVSRALQGLTAEYRLLLTGTPLQNDLLEMWSLLHWLYPEVFTLDTSDNFKRAFNLTQGKVSTTFMDDARRLLEIVMLRRMKNSPGVNLGLPPKEEILLYVPLTPMQRFWYTRFLTKADKLMLDELFKGAKAKEMNALQLESEEDEKQSGLLAKAEEELSAANGLTEDVWAESKEIMEKAMENEGSENQSHTEWRKLMNLVIQLRKVCSHPYILPHAAPDPYYIGEHVKAASGKFIVLDKLLDELVVQQGKKILIFSGWTKTLDLCEDLLALKGFNTLESGAMKYLRLDGGTQRARRNLGIRMFNDLESDFKVMLISTRAGGLGINLATASNVVFLDEDWNPQITLQAEARAHRIGQTQKVTVYKICTQGTVEEQMMGRIRKKLYLSAKITESMRNIHSAAEKGTKRKRGQSGDDVQEDAPQLDATSLKSLIRRGAQTLSRPEVDVTEMLNWDWETTLEKCKDKPIDAHAAGDAEADEQSWLNSMEKVECAVFEGKKHHKELEAAAEKAPDLSRADRRVGKNTTVMVGGFAISKESMNCADWEAVPTMAGKDPRLAEPEKVKKAAINHQDLCQQCRDGGDVVLCSGCPRVYHRKCLSRPFQLKAKGSMFYCPQHECVDCGSNTANAGGLIYRCRWCPDGYCEDCLDWDAAKLVGETIPEHTMLGFDVTHNAWYIECPNCLEKWENSEDDREWFEEERAKIEEEYESFLASTADADTPSFMDDTPATISEVGTPVNVDFAAPSAKKAKLT